jgi:cell volume regulation protein A
MELTHKTMIAWVGLRGAVPIILATFPLLAGLPQANTIFNLVFFIVLTSVLVQGTTLPLVARWLGVTSPISTPYRYPLEFVPDVDIDSQLIEVRIPRTSPIVGRSIMEINLPEGALVITVGRNSETFVPSGATVLQDDDRLLVLADDAAAAEVRRVVTARSSGEKVRETADERR